MLLVEAERRSILIVGQDDANRFGVLCRNDGVRKTIEERLHLFLGRSKGVFADGE